MSRAHINDSSFSAQGVGFFLTHGEPVEVDGQPMVRMSHGAIVPAAGWSASEAEAQLAAADRIEQLGRLLLDQAEIVRMQATQPQEVRSGKGA